VAQQYTLLNVAIHFGNSFSRATLRL